MVRDIRNGRSQFLHRTGLLGRTLAERLGACSHLVGSAGNLVDSHADLRKRIVDGIVDLLHRLLNSDKIPPVLAGHFHCKIALCHFAQVRGNVAHHIGQACHSHIQAVHQAGRFIL